MFTNGNWTDDVVSFSSERRVYESEFAGIVGLIDEISTKRIHIEEEIRGIFIYRKCSN